MLTRHRTAVDPTAIDGMEAGIARAAAKGTLVGFVVVLTIVGGIALSAGAGVMGALGVGAFVALWGGPGWGGMVGAVRYADRIAENERNAAGSPAEAPQGRPAVELAAVNP